ncbi:MAG: methylmalonyl Co-A mutase-associated GTPase MeaB [Anaerolineaceae bacterium]|nr:methylmalonyl Co-A mutase-associated GTPase MeaB [Anaerolineaceae bacterium]
MSDLPEKILSGERRALARLLTIIENESLEGYQAIDELFPNTGKAHIIGVTGSPGVGKSSFVNQIVKQFRNPPEGQQPQTTAILAVDPSSPFTGGALLGDRVRMRDLSGDKGIFIRSMASRGAVGGLAATTAAMTQVLDAAGFDLVIVETVGAGQTEVEIAKLAHTTIVVEAPGMGDEIQAIKAGIMEIADILVVNKADRPGADNTLRMLKAMLEMGERNSRFSGYHRTYEGSEEADFQKNVEKIENWVPPVLKAVSTQKEENGIPEIVFSILCHREYLLRSGLLKERSQKRLESEFLDLMRKRLFQNWQKEVSPEELKSCRQHLFDRKISPHRAVELLVNKSERKDDNNFR